MSGLTTFSTLPLELYVAAQRGELQKVVKWLRKGGHGDALCSWEDEQGSHFATLLHAAAVLGQLACRSLVASLSVLRRSDPPISIGNPKSLAAR